MPKEIELQNGMKAIVDDEDYERVNQFNWTIGVTDITINITRKSNNKIISLSKLILNVGQTDKKILHKNKNALDFQKENLIIVPVEKVAWSRKGNRNSSSKYRGVSWFKSKKKWRADIRVNGIHNYLGLFESEDEAAKAYNRAASEIFGEFAYQNVIGEDNSAKAVSTKIVNIKRTQKHNKTSSYRGVSFKYGGWIAQIKQTYIGLYKTEIEAAKAYNERAKELFGDKAILNDIPNKEESKC